MPTGIANTTTSKSSPWRRTRVSASGRSQKCDSSGAAVDPGVGVELVDERARREAGQAADAHERLVALGPGGEVAPAGPASPPRSRARSAGDVQLRRPGGRTRTPPRAGAAPGRAARTRRRPCRPPSSRRSRRGTRRTSSRSGTPPRPRPRRDGERAAPRVGEDEVVEPADERELGDLRRSAVARDPVEEVLVVERAEAALVGEDPSASMPRTTAVITADECQVRRRSASSSTRPRERLGGGVDRAVERGHRRRDARAVQSPRSCAEASRTAASTAARSRDGARGGGGVADPLSTSRPACTGASGSESRKSRDQLQRAAQDVDDAELAPGRPPGSPGTRSFGVKLPEPVVPAVGPAVLEADGLRREHRVAPGPDRRRRVGRAAGRARRSTRAGGGRRSRSSPARGAGRAPRSCPFGPCCWRPCRPSRHPRWYTVIDSSRPATRAR